MSKPRSCILPFAAGLAIAMTAGSQPARANVEAASLLRAAVSMACNVRTHAQLQAMTRRLPNARPMGRQVRMSMMGWRHRFQVPGGTLTVERLAANGRLRRVSAQYNSADGERPTLLAMTDGDCRIETARRLHYDDAGNPGWIEDLDKGLEPTGAREALNPPVPVGRDPGGVPVALVDTGINYLLPQIRHRLARGADNRVLGYDYWDLDNRPFDAHPVRSAFFPTRHGTKTASVLLAEAPVVRLLPYRYPRPDMRRMGALIQDAATHGVRLVNLSLVSDDREEWLPFYRVARRHPEMLFIVAAGNDGRDIGRHPVYPAALPLDNMVTVTSATAAGALASAANWGADVVDVMTPGEDIPVIDFFGRIDRASGSSYATARITALAACLLAKHPNWWAPQLKAALLRRAQPARDPDAVAHGFIDADGPDFGAACTYSRPTSGV